MNQDTNQIFFALLRSAIRGRLLTGREKALFSCDVLPGITSMAKAHDLNHLISLGLIQNDLLMSGKADAEKETIKAAYRYERLNYEFGRLCDVLEAAEVDFMPLKGSVIRCYYPEPWMRTSCDIDILVHEEDLERASEHLINNRGYSFEKKGSHDVSLFSKGGMHLELHYTLIGNGVAKSASAVLSDVWQSSFVRDGKKYWFEMPDELFYFYHIAHMAKHFEEGGCGIRPFIDLWILDNIEGIDQEKRDELLKKGDLMKFAEEARKLSRIWFDNGEYTDIHRQMESYVLSGGVYGTYKNRVSIEQQKRGGKLKYALSKIFIPYDIIKFQYPILQKHRLLTPIMEVRRWFKILFRGHIRRSVRVLKYNSDISREEAQNIQLFLRNVGL